MTTRSKDLPAFPIDVLPIRLRRLVQEISVSRGVPAVIPATAALATVAASLGRGIVIPSWPGQVCYGNLFLIITAPTCTGKGVGSERAIQPFRQLQQTLRIQRETNGLPVTVKTEEIVNSGLALWDPPVQASRKTKSKRPPTLITEDSTGPAMEVVLAENDELTFSFSSEAGVVLDKVKGEVESLFLKGFAVEAHDSTRITRDFVSLEHPCITLLWLVQPHRLEKLLRTANLIDDGFVGRCLFAHSHARMQEKSVQGNPDIDLTTQSEYDVLIGQLFSTYHRRKNPAPLEVPVSEESRNVMVEFYNWVSHECNACTSVPHRNLMVRWSELAWRMSLVLHAAEFGSEAHLSEVSRQTVENAIRLVQWYGQQALAMVGAPESGDRRYRQLLQILQNSPEGEITERNLKNSHNFSQTEIDDLLARYPAQFERVQMKKKTGGRSSWLIRLKPEEGTQPV